MHAQERTQTHSELNPRLIPTDVSGIKAAVLHVSDAERERLTAKFQEIAAAYEILSDEETRAKYDAGEDVSGSGQQSQGFPGGFPGFPGGFPGGGFQQGGQRFTFTFR